MRETENRASTVRVAIVASHPIQHFCPQYRSWSQLPGIETKVFFASEHGARPYYDPGFGREVAWNELTLDFPHEFLPGAEGRQLSLEIDSTHLDGRLAAFNPHAVVTYGYAQRLQRRAQQWCKTARVPVLMVSDSELRQRRPAIRQFAKKIAIPRILREVDLFLSVGDANEQYYRTYGVEDTRLIRCPFPIDRVMYEHKYSDKDRIRREIRSRHGIPDDHACVLNVGKLVPWKRQADLVELSNRLRASGNEVTVMLAGSGSDEEALRRATEFEGVGGVLYLGFLSPEELADYYLAVDAYVHPAEREPHSLAISEAIYCGLPVVLADRCGSYGPMDDVRLGRNGYVYECGDTRLLQSSLLAVFQGEYAQMSQASREIGVSNQELAHGGSLEQAVRLLKLRTLIRSPR